MPGGRAWFLSCQMTPAIFSTSGLRVTQERLLSDLPSSCRVELHIDSPTLVSLRLARGAPPKSAGRIASTPRSFSSWLCDELFSRPASGQRANDSCLRHSPERSSYESETAYSRHARWRCDGRTSISIPVLSLSRAAWNRLDRHRWNLKR